MTDTPRSDASEEAAYNAFRPKEVILQVCRELERENERLRGHLRTDAEIVVAQQAEIRALRDENERLREEAADAKKIMWDVGHENERLLAELNTTYENIREHGLELLKVGDGIRAALEGSKGGRG